MKAEIKTELTDILLDYRELRLDVVETHGKIMQLFESQLKERTWEFKEEQLRFLDEQQSDAIKITDLESQLKKCSDRAVQQARKISEMQSKLKERDEMHKACNKAYNKQIDTIEKLKSQLKERDFGKYLIDALPSMLLDQYRKEFENKTKLK